MIITLEILKSIRNGESLGSISRRTGIWKSTLYYHYKRIHGKKYKEPKYSIRFSEKEGEIVGIFAGDGSQVYCKSNCNYQTNIHFGDYKGYISYVKELYEKYFNKIWRLNQDSRKDCCVTYRMRMVDKKIFNYFSNYIDYNPHHKHNTVRLKTLKVPNRFKIGFIRGLIDTDGTICKERTGRLRIAQYTTSRSLAKQITRIITSFEITCYRYERKRKGYKRIYINVISARDIGRFLKTFKPFKGRKFGPVAQPVERAHGMG